MLLEEAYEGLEVGEGLKPVKRLLLLVVMLLFLGVLFIRLLVLVLLLLLFECLKKLEVYGFCFYERSYCCLSVIEALFCFTCE